MRHLIAKRDRARDMLTELENDNWAYFSDSQLREVISDDNFALMLAEMQQLKDMRELRMEKDGWTGIKSGFPAVVSFNDMLMEQRQHVVQHQSRLAYWDGQRAHAEKMIGIHGGYIRDCTLHVANRWAKLSDQERAFFGRPPANETSIFNFPIYQGLERGYFYPEPTTWHICVTDKLRVALAALEKEIEEEGGEA